VENTVEGLPTDLLYENITRAVVGGPEVKHIDHVQCRRNLLFNSEVHNLFKPRAATYYF